MEVKIYIGFWTLKPKCTQYGLYEQATFKNAKVRAGHGWGRPRSGYIGQGLGTEARVFLVLPMPAALTRAMLVRGF